MSFIGIKKNNVILLLMCAMLLLGLIGGHRIGYIQSYEYVDNWHEEYKVKWCTCIEPQEKEINNIEYNFNDFLELE